MNTDPDKSPLAAGIFGLFLGVIIGMSLIHYFVSEPLRSEAIQKGYASYVLQDPLNPTSAEFVWK